MTREDITKQFPEATKEQIDALLNIHSADIGKAKGDAAKIQGDLKALQDQLGTVNANRAPNANHAPKAAAARTSICTLVRLFCRANAAGEAIFPANATIAEMEKNKGDVAALGCRADATINADLQKGLRQLIVWLYCANPSLSHKYHLFSNHNKITQEINALSIYINLAGFSIVFKHFFKLFG